MFKFPSKLKTSRNETVNAENFHQFCRYEIAAKKDLYGEESEFENVLKEIAEWIDIRICQEGM